MITINIMMMIKKINMQHSRITIHCLTCCIQSLEGVAAPKYRVWLHQKGVWQYRQPIKLSSFPKSILVGSG